jgi:SAM-dependent methyltransferase
MSKRVKEILLRLSGTGHRGGAFNSEVLIAISEVLPEVPFVSLETGCGKSTVMFSNLASQHYVFAYDDRDAPDSSVKMVQSDPEFRAETTTFVYGPTQRTLPRYTFPDGLMFDVILIDGPHGYPFPDLEYALLYDRLKPGGILILDDVHIASIGAMYDLLREDRMYDEIGVFSTTGLLRRSHLPGVPSDGDHWYEQNYNISRFPMSMEKYHRNRPVKPGELLNLSDPGTLARVALKALEIAPDRSGAQTTDMAASLEMKPGDHSGPVTVELTYRTIHHDAAATATIACEGQSFPLPPHSAMATEIFRFDTAPGRPIRLTLLHPDAIPEHDRGIKRYDFRRLGTVVKSVRLRTAKAAAASPRSTTPAVAAPLKAEPKKLPDAAGIVGELGALARQYPYTSGGIENNQVKPPAMDTEPMSTAVLSRLVGYRHKVHFGELLPFEGARFAEAAVWALCGRRASPEQREWTATNGGAVNRIKFLLELDHANRKEPNPARLSGLKFGRSLWRLERFFRRSGVTPAAKLSAALRRNYSRRKVAALALETSQRRLLLAILEQSSPSNGQGE